MIGCNRLCSPWLSHPPPWPAPARACPLLPAPLHPVLCLVLSLSLVVALLYIVSSGSTGSRLPAVCPSIHPSPNHPLTSRRRPSPRIFRIILTRAEPSPSLPLTIGAGAHHTSPRCEDDHKRHQRAHKGCQTHPLSRTSSPPPSPPSPPPPSLHTRRCASTSLPSPPRHRPCTALAAVTPDLL